MKWPVYIMLLLSSCNLLAQDIHFSQFFAAPMLVNPAQTGLFSGVVRLGGNYRDQWGSVTVPFRTYDFYVDAGVQPGKSVNRLGIGAWALSDQAGDGSLSSGELAGAMAYHLRLDKEGDYKLSTGISGAWVQRTVNFANLTFDSQWNGYNFDAALPNAETGFVENINYLDISAGMVFTATPVSYLRYFLGVAASHLNEPGESFYFQDNTLGTRWQISTGAFFPLSAKVTMHPMLFGSFQKGAREITGGSNFTLVMESGESPRSLLLGTWYRYYDAALLMLGYAMGNLTVSASYDFNFSALTPASRSLGGFEMAIVYTFNNNNKKDPLNCPAYE